MEVFWMANKMFVFLLAFALTISIAFAGSYTIDGNLSDWGLSDNDIKVGLCELNLNDYAGGTNTCANNETLAKSVWIPSHKTVDYVVENNRDPIKHYSTDPIYYPDVSKFYATGVHIKGKWVNQQSYDEPSILREGDFYFLEPIYGERFDLEAIYFDNDEDNAYFAIITSMPQGVFYDGNNPFWMGDLEIKVPPGVDTYGIVLNNHTNYNDGSDTSLIMGNICRNPTWINGTIIDNGHSHIDDCNELQQGNAMIVYKNISIPKEGYSGTDAASSGIFAGLQDTYVIEIKIPLELMGGPDPREGNKVIFHSSLSCGNDVIELGEEDTPFDFGFEIPEMGAIAAGTALVIGGVAFFRIRKKKLGGN
jgi:hypothetical protein